jgi:RNA polymerase sigma-54 factor
MTANEREIACHLIGDLDERGISMTPAEEHAELLGYPAALVEKVRQRLMRLEPLGAGAYDSRECLLIQAEVHRDDRAWGAVAYDLIRHQWTLLMKGDLRRIARAMSLPLTDVQEAYMGIRAYFHFYPISGYAGDDGETLLIQPDVRYFVSGGGGSAAVEVDILEARRYHIRYARGQARYLGSTSLTDEERGRVLEWKYDVGRVARALRQRWETMEQVCRMIGQFQREFFLGDFSPHTLARLTREDVARALDVHPSTVGRAVAGKYAELPNRRIVPLAFFFDSSAPIHALISDLIEEENGQLSDDMLQNFLQRAGWKLTRRAVSLHRESMGILPSHLRLRQRRLYELLNENGYSIAR